MQKRAIWKCLMKWAIYQAPMFVQLFHFNGNENNLLFIDSH